MPSHLTFSIKPIKEFIHKNLGTDYIDPFPYPYKQDAIEYLKVYDKLDSLIRRSTNTREKDINPGPYYRNKFANALLELREERKTNRLLKEQLLINS